MHRKKFSFAPFIVSFAVIFSAVSGSNASDGVGVRQPCVSGQFYPGSAGELQTLIRTYLENASSAPDPSVKALIVPHAGYPYSGQVAAEAYKTVAGQSYDAVIILGFTHRVPFHGVFVDTHDVYETPLGRVPVDQALAEEIRRQAPLLRGGPPGGIFEEHSIEVQIPFLQEVLSPLKIVPIYMSRQDMDSARVVAEAVAGVLRDRRILVVTSTDLSHFHSHDAATKMDRTFISLAERSDIEAIAAGTGSGKIEACGTGPVLALLMIGEAMGWQAPRLLRYANSGDVTGDHRRVVGYAAMVIDGTKVA